MNDRQRLEAIISVVCKYLPPDGIHVNVAMSEIISILVDPLPPPQPPPQRPWVGLTDKEIHNTVGYNETREMYKFALALIAKLKERNHGT